MALFAHSSRRTLQDDISDLSGELARLARRASSTVGDAGESAGSWLSRRSPDYGDMRDFASDSAEVVWREAARALGGATSQIQRRPAAAAMALVGVGILLGLMARR